MIQEDRAYKHVELSVTQAAKKEGAVCGDWIVQEKTAEATTVILADGVGSGIKANLAARFCASRLMKLLDLGFSLREACEKLVETLHQARSSDIPFSAFTVARIIGDGSATLLSYEMPAPLFVENRVAYLPKQRIVKSGHEILHESHGRLKPGDGLLIVSDGVSQAGMGVTCPMGLGMEEVCRLVNAKLNEGAVLGEIPGQILEMTKEVSGGKYGDDTTLALLTCRPGSTVHILSGPPLHKEDDEEILGKFLLADGIKVVCGSVTADIVSRYLGVKVAMKAPPLSAFEPPQYEMDGIDLVTEGAVTLNQAYNLLDENPLRMEKDSGVHALCALLRAADRVYFWMGTAANPAHQGSDFRRIGILPRTAIIPLIAEKLKKIGKLVVVRPL